MSNKPKVTYVPRKTMARRFLSFHLSKAANAATRGNKLANIQFLPDGELTITLNNKRSPSVHRLIREIGLEDAWRFLTKDCMVAHSARSAQLVQSGFYL